VPFDPIDFEARDFVPLSGWPIRHDDVAKYLPRATEVCESPLHNYELEVVPATGDLPARLGDVITTNRLERWSMPTDFGRRYATELQRSEHIRVLMDQHCINLVLDESHQSVACVEVVSRASSPKRIRARIFVLACGGLENARLLLASRTQIPEGIGNHSDMVGRCYMGHISGTHGYLRLSNGGVPPFYRLTKDACGMYMRRRLWLTAQAQRTERLMNIIAFPFRPDLHNPRHRDPVLSLLFLQEWWSSPRRSRQMRSGDLARHLGNVAFATPLAWADIAHQLGSRFGKRPRLPFILPYRRTNRDALWFQGEHAPNRESRVVLSDRTDDFGMPRLEPRVAFSEIDTRTVVGFYALLDRSLRERGLGHVEYTEPALRAYLDEVKRRYRSNAHHIGTTRMSADPRDGVVDADCRVHGVRNLYVAGSSVFPTSGHANPTLMILALTTRLADCLIARRLPIACQPKTTYVASAGTRPKTPLHAVARDGIFREPLTDATLASAIRESTRRAALQHGRPAENDQGGSGAPGPA
jgi:hypothetical protein